MIIDEIVALRRLRPSVSAFRLGPNLTDRFHRTRNLLLPYVLSSLSFVAFPSSHIQIDRIIRKMAEMTYQDYLEHWGQLSALEKQKNEFIEVSMTSPLVPSTCLQDEQELLRHVCSLEESFKQEKLDHERETRFNRDIQLHEMELMEQISSVKNMMVIHSTGR